MAINVPLIPTYQNCFVHDTQDALLLVQAVIDNQLAPVERRPQDGERPHLIRSGNIFIFDENCGQIQRWTDGISWSPSRILGEFLLYREKTSEMRPGSLPLSRRASKYTEPMVSDGSIRKMQPRRPLSSYPRMAHSNYDPALAYRGPASSGSGFMYSDPMSIEMRRSGPEYHLYGSLASNDQYKENGLIKKTISIPYGNSSYRLVSYYVPQDVESGILVTPSEDPKFSATVVDPELAVAKNMKVPVSLGSLSTFNNARTSPKMKLDELSALSSVNSISSAYSAGSITASGAPVTGLNSTDQDDRVITDRTQRNARLGSPGLLSSPDLLNSPGTVSSAGTVGGLGNINSYGVPGGFGTLGAMGAYNSPYIPVNTYNYPEHASGPYGSIRGGTLSHRRAGEDVPRSSSEMIDWITPTFPTMYAKQDASHVTTYSSPSPQLPQLTAGLELSSYSSQNRLSSSDNLPGQVQKVQAARPSSRTPSQYAEELGYPNYSDHVRPASHATKQNKRVSHHPHSSNSIGSKHRTSSSTSGNQSSTGNTSQQPQRSREHKMSQRINGSQAMAQSMSQSVTNGRNLNGIQNNSYCNSDGSGPRTNQNTPLKHEYQEYDHERITSQKKQPEPQDTGSSPSTNFLDQKAQGARSHSRHSSYNQSTEDSTNINSTSDLNNKEQHRASEYNRHSRPNTAPLPLALPDSESDSSNDSYYTSSSALNYNRLATSYDAHGSNNSDIPSESANPTRSAQVNQLSQIDRIERMDRIDKMNHLGQVNQVNQMNQMNRMDQMDQMGQMGQMGQMNSMNSMNRPLAQTSQQTQTSESSQGSDRAGREEDIIGSSMFCMKMPKHPLSPEEIKREPGLPASQFISESEAEAFVTKKEHEKNGYEPPAYREMQYQPELKLETFNF